METDTGGLQFGSRGDGGLNCIYPCDLVPFTRRPLFLVIDSDNSEAFKALAGAEKGESVAMLLSPSSSPIASSDLSCHSSGSLFTIFLTAPLQAFCMLLGIASTDIKLETYNKADKLLSSSLNDWALALATADTLHLVWAETLVDPFLRRLLLRFLFCQTVLTLYAPIYKKKEFLPTCIPPLPASVMPTTAASQNVIVEIASIFGAADSFIFNKGIVLPENRHSKMDFVSTP
ncbi:protein SCAI-like [Quillaja saponaria]|uniref:Protein SCAI-like n=1 Tax=Quillaja saponaria TaxID=32244 RepID=A0AAD7L3G9_QUISA|nr:protein SCAI-like [Quillaja saponaria]